MSDVNALQLFDGTPELYPEYVTESGPRFGRPEFGRQIVWCFPNGYGASVVLGLGSYGLEMAVLHGDSLCYATPLGDDVIPYIPGPRELASLIRQVKELPSDSTCEHGR